MRKEVFGKTVQEGWRCFQPQMERYLFRSGEYTDRRKEELAGMNSHELMNHCPKESMTHMTACREGIIFCLNIRLCDPSDLCPILGRSFQLAETIWDWS